MGSKGSTRRVSAAEPVQIDIGDQSGSDTSKIKGGGAHEQLADYGGRPSPPCFQPPPASAVGLSCGPSCPWLVSWPFSLSVSCFGGLFDLCEPEFCALIGRSFVPWIMPHHLAVNLAQIHLHTISNQHMWNSLIFYPVLAFIPFYAWFLCRI